VSFAGLMLDTALWPTFFGRILLGRHYQDPYVIAPRRMENNAAPSKDGVTSPERSTCRIIPARWPGRA
jgi:hypothetical protein